MRARSVGLPAFLSVLDSADRSDRESAAVRSAGDSKSSADSKSSPGDSKSDPTALESKASASQSRLCSLASHVNTIFERRFEAALRDEHRDLVLLDLIQFFKDVITSPAHTAAGIRLLNEVTRANLQAGGKVRAPSG